MNSSFFTNIGYCPFAFKFQAGPENGHHEQQGVHHWRRLHHWGGYDAVDWEAQILPTANPNIPMIIFFQPLLSE